MFQGLPAQRFSRLALLAVNSRCMLLYNSHEIHFIKGRLSHSYEIRKDNEVLKVFFFKKHNIVSVNNALKKAKKFIDSIK